MMRDTVTLCADACRTYNLDVLFGAYLIASVFVLVLIGAVAGLAAGARTIVRWTRRDRIPRTHLSYMRSDVKTSKPLFAPWFER